MMLYTRCEVKNKKRDNFRAQHIKRMKLLIRERGNVQLSGKTLGVENCFTGDEL